MADADYSAHVASIKISSIVWRRDHSLELEAAFSRKVSGREAAQRRNPG